MDLGGAQPNYMVNVLPGIPLTCLSSFYHKELSSIYLSFKVFKEIFNLNFLGGTRYVIYPVVSLAIGFASYSNIISYP